MEVHHGLYSEAEAVKISNSIKTEPSLPISGIRFGEQQMQPIKTIIN